MSSYTEIYLAVVALIGSVLITCTALARWRLRPQTSDELEAAQLLTDNILKSLLIETRKWKHSDIWDQVRESGQNSLG